MKYDFESLVVELENVANFMRGMAMFDLSIPKHMKESMLDKVAEIDFITSEIQDN